MSCEESIDTKVTQESLRPSLEADSSQEAQRTMSMNRRQQQQQQQQPPQPQQQQQQQHQQQQQQQQQQQNNIVADDKDIGKLTSAVTMGIKDISISGNEDVGRSSTMPDEQQTNGMDEDDAGREDASSPTNGRSSASQQRSSGKPHQSRVAHQRHASGANAAPAIMNTPPIAAVTANPTYHHHHQHHQQHQQQHQSGVYDELPPPMYTQPPFVPVAPYFTTQFYAGPSGQFFYDPQQYRFARPHAPPPPPIASAGQTAFVRSNLYSYQPVPMMPGPPLHPAAFQHGPVMSPPPATTARYLTASGVTAGGDSGFSSRRSSVDQQNRTPDLGPAGYSQRVYQKKPKQLDKALWVGNLPDTTTHEELEQFFADENMESVFLIKKSNCAFVNYKTYEAVMDAVQRYNDAEFKGIKLVCRPRKQTAADLKNRAEPLSTMLSCSPTEHTPTPTPSETGSTASSSTRSHRSSYPPPPRRYRQPSIASLSPASSVSSLKPSSSIHQQQNRYFILKSLTQDDLDISVQTGVWATQPHNEAALNKAFKSAENVYLIFSANKSGEFYGYARMASLINKETTEPVQWTPIDEAALAASSSRPSPVQHADGPVKKRSVSGIDTDQQQDVEDCEEEFVPSSRNWGTAFKVQWMKVQKLPFTRTRHLRNPWNANREVKISRDGTEVEPSIGDRLLTEFHKVLPPVTLPMNTAGASAYGPQSLSGPLLTHPLTVDSQGVVNASDSQDGGGSLVMQQVTPSNTGSTGLPPAIIDPTGAATSATANGFIQAGPPHPTAYFAPGPPAHPSYWPPQPLLIPYSGASGGFVQSGGAAAPTGWTASTGPPGSKDRGVGSLDQQQYVEVIWGPTIAAHHHSTNHHFQQQPPQPYYLHHTIPASETEESKHSSGKITEGNMSDSGEDDDKRLADNSDADGD